MSGLLPEVLDIRDAATMLRITVEHARKLAQRDKWRRIKTGRTVLYWMDDIEKTGKKRATRGGA